MGIDRYVAEWGQACALMCGVLWVVLTALVFLIGADGFASAPVSSIADDRLFMLLTVLPGVPAALADLLAGTADAAFAVTSDGVIVGWNEAAGREFGHPAARASGARCWELLAGQDIFSNRYCCEGCALRQAAFAHEAVRGSALSFRTATGGRRRFHVTLLVVPLDGGREALVHLCRPVSRHDPILESSPVGKTLPGTREYQELTPRELTLLRLLSAGMGTAEIAAEMSVSVATVRNHMQNVMRKLRVHSRTAAVVRAQQIGLV